MFHTGIRGDRKKNEFTYNWFAIFDAMVSLEYFYRGVHVFRDQVRLNQAIEDGKGLFGIIILFFSCPACSNKACLVLKSSSYNVYIFQSIIYSYFTFFVALFLVLSSFLRETTFLRVYARSLLDVFGDRTRPMVGNLSYAPM